MTHSLPAAAPTLRAPRHIAVCAVLIDLAWLNLAALCGVAAAVEPHDQANAAIAQDEIDFARDILPLLTKHCYQCHGSKRNEGGLKLSDPDSALQGGASGRPAIVPGIPEASRMLQLIKGEDLDRIMPPREVPERLSGEEITLFERWIRAGAKRPTMLDAGSEKQLLIDGQLVARSENVTFRAHPPRKTSEVLISADRAWEGSHICGQPTVMLEEGRYRAWYDAYAEDSQDQAPGPRLCYAESQDGRNWTKPELGLVPFRGTTANNIVFPDKPIAYRGGTVFYDSEAAVAERYKLVGVGSDGLEGAVSSDGVHWFHVGTILRGVEVDGKCTCFLDPRLRRYVLYCQSWTGGEPGKGSVAIGRSESTEFRSFTSPKIVFQLDAEESKHRDLRSATATMYSRAGNAYFLFPAIVDRRSAAFDVQLAVSRDGVKWARYREPVWIPRGMNGELDSMCVFPSSGCVARGDELVFHYAASSTSLDKLASPGGQKAGVITRAIGRLDGFVSADAPETGGTLTTIPLTFVGDRLEVNATGRLRVALLDRQGRPVAGHTLDECDIIDGDSVRHVVKWKGKTSVSAFCGQLVQLQFELQRASLYAFQFVAAQP